jgi:hypothetical protein
VLCMRRLPLILVVACAAIVPLAACSDDESDIDSTVETTASVAAPATEASTTTAPTTQAPDTVVPTQTEAPLDTTVQPSSAAVFAITADVRGGKPSGGVRSYLVEVGQTVEITITSDERDEAHLHGYDLDTNLEPGVAATLRFTADTAGSFEMEMHGSGALLFYLDVV